MKLLLTTLNAKYTHSSLALRYLREYCKSLPCEIAVKEFSINQHPLDMLGQIYEEKPDVIGVSCYIWNIEMTLTLIAMVKKVLPEVKVICGGPEVSYQSKEFLQSHTAIDYLVQGEGEETLYRLLHCLIHDEDTVAVQAISRRDEAGAIIVGQAAVISDLNTIPFPYHDADIVELGEKIIYYESSRGCPFSCQYCLSSATQGVRFFSIDRVLAELKFFIQHKVRQIKFVDRTFNTKKEHYLKIWEFLQQQDCRTNFHFEIASDLLDEEVLSVLERMPKGRIQLEIGIQSTNELTLQKIKRHNHWEKIVYNVKKLLSFHNMHLHLDLIIGLPEEGYQSFQQSFNDVYVLQPHMLQIGFLKMLKGSGITVNAKMYEYIFMDTAPYQVLSNKFISYGEIRFLQIFEEVFEQYYNSGRFKNTIKFLISKTDDNAFLFYERLTVYWRKNNLHIIAHSVKSLYNYLFAFCNEDFPQERETVKQFLKFDALVTDKASILPDFLPWSEREFYEQTSEFWRSERAIQYLPGFQFTNWRDLKKKQRIEVFDFSLVQWKEKNQIVEARKAYLFSYAEEEIKFQEIAAADFNI